MPDGQVVPRVSSYLWAHTFERFWFDLFDVDMFPTGTQPPPQLYDDRRRRLPTRTTGRRLTMPVSQWYTAPAAMAKA